MSDCIFCKIASGEIPCSMVYQDEEVIAFKDINPLAPVHILIIPKQHMESAMDVNEENSRIIGHIFKKIGKIAKDAGIAENGFRIVSNVGKDGGQLVKHLHFHILGGRQLDSSLG
ncbi:MAG: histidine triad nucleotide-binding protein [Caulobacteraceae bacterium]